MDRCDDFIITPIKEITTQTIPNYENEIVADILNTIINNICIKDDLKEKKLEVVDL